jgi:hypothetical protein
MKNVHSWLGATKAEEEAAQTLCWLLVPVWPSAGWSSAAERTHPFWDIKPEDSTVNPSADEHKAAQWKAMIGMSRHIHHSMNTRLMEKTM